MDPGHSVLAGDRVGRGDVIAAAWAAYRGSDPRYQLGDLPAMGMAESALCGSSPKRLVLALMSTAPRPIRWSAAVQAWPQWHRPPTLTGEVAADPDYAAAYRKCVG